MAPVAFKSAGASRTRQVRSCAVKAVPAHKAASVATVGVAAAVLLAASPAFAGVTLEQPKLKNFSKEAEVVAKAPVVKGEKAPKAESQAPNILPASFNTQSLWPVGVVACGAALLALIKVDPVSKDLFDNAVKDSGEMGIGFEDVLKNKGGYAAPYYEQNGATPSPGGGGTKALKKAPKKAAKKAAAKAKGAAKGAAKGLFSFGK